MTQFFSKSSVAVGLLVLAATVASPSLAATPYDGDWSVVIVTQAGTCDAAYRYPLRIENGEVKYGGDNSFNVSGRVGANGAVNVSISLGESKASGSGRLSGAAGSGTWSGKSANSACSGRWEAERKS